MPCDKSKNIYTELIFSVIFSSFFKSSRFDKLWIWNPRRMGLNRSYFEFNFKGSNFSFLFQWQRSSLCHSAVTPWKPDTRNVSTVRSFELPYPVSGILLQASFLLGTKSTNNPSRISTFKVPYPTQRPFFESDNSSVKTYDNVIMSTCTEVRRTPSSGMASVLKTRRNNETSTKILAVTLAGGELKANRIPV